MAFFLSLPLLMVNAQDEVSKPLMVYPTITVGFGFFYPEQVNEYIEEKINWAYSTSVNTELYMYYEIKGGLAFRLKKIDFSAALEYDIAPKFVVVAGGDNISYSYSRFAPEIAANFYIPNNSGKNAFFIGAGINYSFMKFKEYSAATPGFAVRAGYSLQFKSINIQPYGLFRYVQATDPSDYMYGGEIDHPEFNLSYTAGQIGVIISFHKRMLYK
jgi:hypothetical protein